MIGFKNPTSWNWRRSIMNRKDLRKGRGAYMIRSKMIMIMGLCYKAVTAAIFHYTGYLFKEDIISFKNSTPWNWRMRIMNRKDLKKGRGAYKIRSKKMIMGLCRR
jgi:hypothetical protein